VPAKTCSEIVNTNLRHKPYTIRTSPPTSAARGSYSTFSLPPGPPYISLILRLYQIILPSLPRFASARISTSHLEHISLMISYQALFFLLPGLLALSAEASRQCYFPNHNVAVNDTACTANGVSICCQQGAACLDNG
jgi:hypothetical protein